MNFAENGVPRFLLQRSIEFPIPVALAGCAGLSLDDSDPLKESALKTRLELDVTPAAPRDSELKKMGFRLRSS